MNQIYYLLTNELLDSDISNQIIELYYKNFDNSPHTLSSIIHLFIINNIDIKNIEFAFLISNYIILKKGRWFLMPFEYCHNDYKKAIDSNDLSSLIRVSFDIETIRKEKIPCKFSYDKVIERVKSIKDKLIKEYDIKKLYLFGSFAKGKNTEKSDIDFLVAFNDDLINKERKDRIKVLIEYFKN